MEINRVNSLLSLGNYGEKVSDNTKDKESFSDFLSNALNQVNQLQVDSSEYKRKLALGEVDNLHDLSIASEKADVAMQITLSIRNKIVEAYKEILRIQI